MEGYRTDGTWSEATVTDFDEGEFVYTIHLLDGRFKYLVVSAVCAIRPFGQVVVCAGEG